MNTTNAPATSAQQNVPAAIVPRMMHNKMMLMQKLRLDLS